METHETWGKANGFRGPAGIRASRILAGELFVTYGFRIAEMW